MTWGVAEFFSKLKKEVLAPDVEGDRPWDMTQYRSVLGTTRIPLPGRDKCVTNSGTSRSR